MQLIENKFSEDEYERYTRHFKLSEIQILGQYRLKKAKVLCVGAGGLASPVLLYLAAAGVGNIAIVDDDIVGLSNLQRQIIYANHLIGEKKVKVAKQRLSQLNPNCKIDIYDFRLNSFNVSKLIYRYDLIVDATDNFSTRYLLNNICKVFNKIYIYGAISQFNGQMSIFNYKGSFNYLELNNYNTNNILDNDCNDNGVIGVLPAVIGSLQATEVIKLILGIPLSLYNKLLLYDALKMDFTIMQLKRRKQRYLSFHSRKTFSYLHPTMNSFKNDITVYNKNTSNVLIIDIRTAYECFLSPIQDAINIPLNQLLNDTNMNFLQKESIDKEIKVFCSNYSRSQTAIKVLKKYKIVATPHLLF
jgi:sulfur-carrier protein adenylyltransferase/sulfurtransferase